MIAIEPDWNMFLQKGIGGAIREKLRRVGINLEDQSNNQLLAGLGSLYGDLATIDLSMASDCMSYELVRFLLPPDWFDALEQCRSQCGVLPSGSVVIYEKFSSMGNGATFDLETLIFWALSAAVIDLMELEDRRLLVYGDDIIVPTAAFQNVCDVLEMSGFRPNRKKSFGAGPFRESCGSHFHEGDDVTPIYIREAVTRLDRLFLLHNNTCRLLDRMGQFVSASPQQIEEFLEWMRSHAPSEWKKPRLPRLDIGDGAFFGIFEECAPRKAKKGYDGWRINVLRQTVKDPLAGRKTGRKKDKDGFYIEPPLIPESNIPPVERLWCSLWDLEHGTDNWWYTVRVIRAASKGGFPLKPLSREADVPAVPQPRSWACGQPLWWETGTQLVSGLTTDYPWWKLTLLSTR
jgi:hypothetical protein